MFLLLNIALLRVSNFHLCAYGHVQWICVHVGDMCKCVHVCVLQAHVHMHVCVDSKWQPESLLEPGDH